MTTIDDQGVPPEERPSTGRMVLHFSAGFVVTQIICGLGLLMFLFSIDVVRGSFETPLKVGVASVVGAMVGAGIVTSAILRRRFPLLLPGAIVGTVLGMMALGPCAFCYIAMDL